jgi:hypothetical protein
MSSAEPRRWRERVPKERPPEEESSTDRAAERVTFYDDLVRFESQVLERMLDLAKSLEGEMRREVEASNIDPLRALIAELMHRRDEWAARRDSAGH